jgi:hypothetical protein
MSGQTYKISNGDRDIDPSTGLQRMISGRDKGAQDIADCLMIIYDPDENFGSELMKLQVTGGPEARGVVLAKVGEALNRLILKTQEDPSYTTDDALEIQDIRVFPDTIDKTTYWFFITVRMQNVTIEKALTVKVGPTKLFHQLPSEVQSIFNSVMNG